MKARPPKIASKSIVCLRKVVKLGDRIDDNTYGTGFFFRKSDNSNWLITNWHVVTSRRPDNPGHLNGGASSSPSGLKFELYLRSDDPSQLRTVEHYLPLYDAAGQPKWLQHSAGPSIDLIAIPFKIEEEFDVQPVQQFSTMCTEAVEPGFDLTVVGYPFPQSDDVSFPLWKRAMIASEPKFQSFGLDQILIDTPGTPGMSGSPVFMTERAWFKTAEEVAREQNGNIWDEDALSWMSRERETLNLEFVGVYAGATGDARLEHLKLGRMFPLPSLINVVEKGVPGKNPFPPHFED